MKASILCIIGLLGSAGHAANPQLDGHVRLPSGAPVPGAQVLLFDLTDLRAAPRAATTDGSGHFTLPLASLSGALPERFELGANYPNPFNPSTMIPYQLPAAMQVRLEVFNILGQRIATLVDGEQPAGFHTASWDATDAAGQAVGAGVYIYRLVSDGQAISRRMLLIDGQAGIARAGPGDATSPSGEKAPVFGLAVSGPGLVPYVNPAFRVEAGIGPLDVVVEAPGRIPPAKTASSGGILGDVNNTGEVNYFDFFLVLLYSYESSILMPNNGDISLGDTNADGRVDLSDAYLIEVYLNDPADPSLPSGIGEPPADLVVESVSVSDQRLTPGQSFTLSATVRNQGTGRRSTATTLRWYRSDDATISTGDTEVDTVAVGALGAQGTSAESISLTAPSSAGTWYYGACVVSVADESNTRNNCSGVVTVTVEERAVVAIPDANLRAAIEKALGKASGEPITQAEMKTLTYLSGFQRGISDLTGLEFATNLRDLHLSENLISDISALSGLTNLRGLSLTFNNIQDISALSGLTNLRDLHLSGNLISDISALSGLTNLRDLQLGKNLISDISPLAANTGLGEGDRVDLAYNPLSSASRNTHIPALQRRDVTVLVSLGTVSRGLIIQSFEVSDSTMTAGQSFTFETTVHNQGADTAIGWLFYYRSTDATIDDTDVNIHRDMDQKDIEPSATQTVLLGSIAPPYAGTYYYGVCASQGDRDFTHCSTVRVTVEGSMGGTPDLTVHPPSVSHPIVDPGGGTTFTTVYENIGSGPAAPTSYRMYRSDDAIIDANDEVIEIIFTLPYMPAGKSHRHNFYFTLLPRVAGTYYYGWCVDPTIGETNSGNNCSTGVPVTVKADEGGSPDLIVAAPGILDHRPAAGEFRLWASVRNIGISPSARTTLRYYFSDDPAIDANDMPVRSRNIPFLAVENIHSFPAFYYPHASGFLVTAPKSPGTYYYGACVDPVPGESDTNNNCSEGVPMNVGVPDLAVGLAHVSTSTPLQGQSFTLTATARNQGPEQAASTTLRWYRSDDPAIDANDTPIGTGAVSSLKGFDGLVSGPGSRLAPSGTSRQAIRVSAPSMPGTYYYGACADPVPGEANTDNNCSAGVYVRVVPSGEDPFNIELVFVDDFTDARKDVMRQAARHWETIITEGLPDVDFSANPFRYGLLDADDAEVGREIDDTVDDLRIFVHTFDLEGPSGIGGPSFVRSGNPIGLPALGGVVIAPNSLDRRQRLEPLWIEERLLRDLMLHEIAHVLGFGPLWTVLDLRHDLAGDIYFSGERAIEAFNAAGGESYSGNKVPLELKYEGFTCGLPSHWRSRVFQGWVREFGAEIMEPMMQREHALSAITIQSIADLGYVVDVSRADPYRLPASLDTYLPPTARAKPVAGYGDFDLGALGTIYVGDEQGRVIRVMEDWISALNP